VGYFSLSEHGLILEANLSAAGLLGVARQSRHAPRRTTVGTSLGNTIGSYRTPPTSRQSQEQKVLTVL